MKRIQTCLWFNTQAEEAAKFYVSVFADSRIRGVVPYGKSASEASGQLEGSVMTVDFEIAGMSFLALNGGPHFKIDPSISFFVGCESESEINDLWKKLKHSTRMELQKYPFAQKYGWCEDRFGVNWQLILGSRRQKIAPALLFSKQLYGKAGEAIEFYTSRIPNSETGMIARDEKSGAVLHSTITLAGQEFVLMEGPLDERFGFSPAVSFILNCEGQAEIDDIWSKLSAVPEAEQCGWLCDKYGVSWQVVSHDWSRMLMEADANGRERLMRVILEMKKPDLARLKRAVTGG